MSSYDGVATLESWLEHEVFEQAVPTEVVALFEQWRKELEQHLENYFDTDDGDGCNSWRGYGRGYDCISDEAALDAAISEGKVIIAKKDRLEMQARMNATEHWISNNDFEELNKFLTTFNVETATSLVIVGIARSCWRVSGGLPAYLPFIERCKRRLTLLGKDHAKSFAGMNV